MTIRFLPALSLSCATLLLLTACADTRSPAAVAGVSSGTTPGTVDAIARKYSVAQDDLIRVNNLKPPYRLVAGQRLKLPAPRAYIAKPGDTLATVAKKYGVTPADIARVNGIPSRTVPRSGQSLRLPPGAKTAQTVTVGAGTTGATAVTKKGATAKTVPAFSLSGKSLNSVIRHFALYDDDNADPVAPIDHALATMTPSRPIGIDPPAPGMTAAANDASDAASPAAMTGRSTIQAESLSAPAAASPAAPTPTVPVVEGHAADAAALPDKPATPAPAKAAGILSTQPAGRFNWPVRGRVISAYGTKGSGMHNDGINIRAAKGTAVHAAGPGTVVYAGDGVKGYGNLVLIRHADRWMTAYAHMDSIAVAKGQTVGAGDTLGAVGSTGGVSAPQLHFEIRHGTEPLNPLAYMPKS